MTQDEDKSATVSEDTKEKFRQALEKKRSARQRTSEGTGNTGQVHGSETAGPMQRNFRRKSG
ncbi:DUF5302 domain-containing protein [Sanguibacter suaedae]|uniref:DUF5302 domain-containing protein n=1 Tax=Sanguibacter suaedae TaxID=2795737 RepID=A0A934ME93_9MICO|nr:DUF5302 domain-containing protein [Sanguibacter suaedae]MBI9115484.1 DUF5302 domain-containing protein [Sanguibacter suaedae]